MQLDSVRLRQFFGGQLFFTVPITLAAAEAVRVTIDEITVEGDTLVIHGLTYRKPAGQRNWIACPNMTHFVITSPREEESAFVGEISLKGTGWFARTATVMVTIISYEDPRLETIAPPRTSVDEALLRSGLSFGLVQEWRQNQGTIVAVERGEDILIPVTPTPYTIFGMDAARIDDACIMDGQVLIGGWVEGSAGGVSLGQRKAVGRGATFAEAVAAFRAVP